MHKILERQINRYLGGLDNVPDTLKKFLDIVSKTYTDFEKEYALMERSLNISSRELEEINEKLRGDVTATKKRERELETLNDLMTDREVKMIELKKEIAALKKGKAQVSMDASKGDE